MADVIIILLAAAFAISAGVNYRHWRQQVGGRFLFQPFSGWLGKVFMVWSLLLVVAAILFLLGLIPKVVPATLVFGQGIAQQCYSIARRRQLQANAYSLPTS